MSKDKRNKIKEKTRYIVVDPEVKNEEEFIRRKTFIEKSRRSSSNKLNYSDGFFSNASLIQSQISQSKSPLKF